MKFNKKIKAFWNIIAANLFGKRTPLCIDFIITYKCNSRCKYCNVHLRKVPEMDTSKIFSLIDSLHKAGCVHISISGGEPLIREDIGTIIDYIKSKDMLSSLTTNGYLLPEKVHEIKNLDVITISLDGPKEVHDKIRGENSLKKSLHAIDIAIKNNFKVMTITVLNKNNINLLDYILDMSSKKGFRCFFQPMYTHPLYSQNTDNLVPSKQEYTAAINRLIREKKRNKLLVGSPNYFRFLLSQKLPFHKCFSSKLFCRIEPNGKVYPCMDSVSQLGGLQFNGGSFSKLFNRLPILDHTKCKSCICPLYWEYNYFFSFNIQTITDTLNLIKRKLSKC